MFKYLLIYMKQVQSLLINHRELLVHAMLLLYNVLFKGIANPNDCCIRKIDNVRVGGEQIEIITITTHSFGHSILCIVWLLLLLTLGFLFSLECGDLEGDSLVKFLFLRESTYSLYRIIFASSTSE